MIGTFHRTFALGLGLNLFLLISFVQSKAVKYCTGEFVEDVDFSKGVCAKLYVSNNTDPFIIPADTGSPYSRSDWDRFISNSDEVKCIKVSKQHVLRLCHLNACQSYKNMVCRSSDDFQKENEKWDKSPKSILGFDCGKKLARDANCHETCEKAEDLTDKRQCATLYIGEDCSTCSFNSVPLYYNQMYDRKDSNLSTIMSIKLRENCSVLALHEDQDKDKETQYTFQNERFRSDIHDSLQYEYKKFWCTCTDTTDLMETMESLPTSQELIGTKLPLILLIAIGAILALLVTTVVLLVVQHFYISRISEKKLYNALSNLSEELIIPRERVVLETEIGKGRYGVVYKGYMMMMEPSGNGSGSIRSEDSGFAQGFSSSKLTVAVKKIKSSSIDSFYVSSLAGEIDILSKLGTHPNVVSMLGACTENKSMNEEYMDDESGLLLIMEFCEHKSLEKFLRLYKKHFAKDDIKQSRLKAEGYSFDEVDLEDGFEFELDQFNVRLLVEWSRQIASGMEHISKSKILHLDLAARNVLLDKNLTAKISDFGLSKILEDSSNYYTRPAGKSLPVFTTPPEALKSYEFSKKTDVWAFGVCMWEIFSFGEVPYAETCELKSEKDFLNYFKFKLDSGYRLPKPEMSSAEMYELMRKCWNTDPNDRPDFSELKTILEKYEQISES